MTNEEIAKVCHEANRAYCELLGDFSQPPWKEAPEWQRTSAVNGVMNARDPEVGFADSHDSWMAEKLANGWRWGPTKDPEKKQHPLLVRYEDLPEQHRRKDRLFLAVARALF